MIGHIFRLNKHWGNCLTTCLLLLAFSGSTLADQEEENKKEYSVKAAFIYNFSKFIDWPELASQKSNEFNICIIGSNPFEKETLSKLSTKKTKAKNVKFLNISPYEKLPPCYIVFINTPENTVRQGIIRASKKHNVLTVSDQENFTSNGGAIELFTSNRKVRFKINLAATKRAGLEVSSKLLNLAIKVENREAQQ